MAKRPGGEEMVTPKRQSVRSRIVQPKYPTVIKIVSDGPIPNRANNCNCNDKHQHPDTRLHPRIVREWLAEPCRHDFWSQGRDYPWA
jgi:hypothetical protein